MKKLMEPDFWKMISEASWTTITNSNVIRNKIKVSYPPYKAEYFKNIAHDFATQLADTYCQTIRKINHYTAIVAAYEAVALGRSTYQEYLDDPSKLKTIIETVDTSNTEALFIFALPSEDDYYQENSKSLNFDESDDY